MLGAQARLHTENSALADRQTGFGGFDAAALSLRLRTGSAAWRIVGVATVIAMTVGR